MSSSENWNPWRNALVLFGRTLRTLREDAGLTQQALGERIHASNRTLSDLELGKGERVPAEALVVAYVDRCIASWQAAEVKRDERRADLLRSYRLLHDLREQLRSSEKNDPAPNSAPKHEGAADDFDGLFLRLAVLPDDALPSMLLRPEYGVVPFSGRQAEVADLPGWTSGAGVAARLVTGPAGQGKTRLGLRLCELVQAEGWVAGIVSEDGDPALIESLAPSSRPLLLVVDYAEARVPALLSLARTLLARPAGSPARLLLLARSAGGWLGELHRDDDAVAGLFLRTVEQRLTPLARSVADRHAEFARALGAIAFQLRRGTEDVDPPPGIDTVRYERALDIHAAALAALLDLEIPEDRSDPQRDPVLRVLHHEQRYWRRTADSAGLPDRDQRRVRCVVALATLFGAGSVRPCWCRAVARR
ncbi:helix-turn-helix transcriptional regulator [Lentzea sp. NPDC059081]|uniref:helix-turn-helix transcriptional regulator n=1 Tax=Lentzea sp. NPDC059081 TaxID=3346719 RepID=UPI0036766878